MTWATPHVGGLGASQEGPWTLEPASDPQYAPLEVVVQVDKQSAAGKQVGWLSVHSDDATAPVRVVQMNLNVDTPKLRPEPKTITAARAQLGSSVDMGGQTLTIHNDGAAPLEIRAAYPEDGCADWCDVRYNVPLPVSVEPGAATQLEVVISSDAPEGSTGNVVIGALPVLAHPLEFPSCVV